MLDCQQWLTHICNIWCVPHFSRTRSPGFGQASRFQIIKTHVGRTAVTEDKENVEEMELAATNSNSLEAWLSTIEVSLLA